MNHKALIKWSSLCAAGAACLVLALLCYFRQSYTFVLAAAFAGCFLVSASGKKIRLLAKAGRTLKAGAETITVTYRDHNLKEYETTVLPLHGDRMFFYGYSPEKKDIKVFRWERIIRACNNGKELKKDDILQSIAGI